MNITEAFGTLRNQFELLSALAPLERTVMYHHLSVYAQHIITYCQNHAPDDVGDVQRLDDAIRAFCQGGIGGHETNDEQTRIRRAIVLLQQRLAP